jgi:hypothetical protein
VTGTTTTATTVDTELAPDPMDLPQELCTACGMPSEHWSDPVSKDGDRYCCADCAAGTACSCQVTPQDG